MSKPSKVFIPARDREKSKAAHHRRRLIIDSSIIETGSASSSPITEIIPLFTDQDGVIRYSRVTLDTIVAAFNEGATAEEIAQQYPLADVYSVIGYYLRHQVAAYLTQRQRQSEQVRQ